MVGQNPDILHILWASGGTYFGDRFMTLLVNGTVTRGSTRWSDGPTRLTLGMQDEATDPVK